MRLLCLVVLGFAGSPVFQSATQEQSLPIFSTTAPTVTKDDEIRWVAHLMEKLFYLAPAQRVLKKNNDREIALLLEIVSHKDAVLLSSAPKFCAKVGYGRDYDEVHDCLRLIEGLQVNHPNPRPLQVRDHRISFISVWPGARTGRWSNPYGSDKFHGGAHSHAISLKKYGLRNLSPFSSQMLTGGQRIALWQAFKKSG